MEKPEHLHEIVRPIRELVRGVLDFAVEKIVPTEVFDEFVQGRPRGAAELLDAHLYDDPTEDDGLIYSD